MGRAINKRRDVKFPIEMVKLLRGGELVPF